MVSHKLEHSYPLDGKNILLLIQSMKKSIFSSDNQYLKHFLHETKVSFLVNLASNIRFLYLPWPYKLFFKYILFYSRMRLVYNDL